MLGLSSFFLFISFLHVFLNLTKTSANSSDWHLDGTDDSEVFHNVILMLVYRVKVLLETGESESVDRYN